MPTGYWPNRACETVTSGGFRRFGGEDGPKSLRELADAGDG
jgi:hypothetical protein